jgi:hypothetical protein
MTVVAASAGQDPGAIWQRVVEDDTTPLNQGDQVWQAQYYRATETGEQWTAQEHTSNVVVLTGSCDIQSKSGFFEVLTAPMYSVYDWVADTPGDVDRLEEIRTGRDLSLFLLPKLVDARVPGAADDRVVDFASVVTIPQAQLISAAKARHRLALVPPARELLAQAYARSIMRVALEVDIPSYHLAKPPGTESVDFGLSELLPFPDDEDQSKIPLLKPLRGKMTIKARKAGDERFVVLLVTLDNGSALRGAGRDEDQAKASLSRNFGILRSRYLDEGDSRYEELERDYLPEPAQ